MQPPPSTGPARSVWKTGCLVGGTFVMLACAGSCGLLWFAGRGLLGEWLITRLFAEPVQRQADAMGHDPPDFATTCRANSALLESRTPCAHYVAWMMRAAPFFAGSRVTVERIDFDSPREGMLRLGLSTSESGARGNGRLRFTVANTPSGWMIDEVRPW